jgi:hypothetical protein
VLCRESDVCAAHLALADEAAPPPARSAALAANATLATLAAHAAAHPAALAALSASLAAALATAGAAQRLRREGAPRRSLRWPPLDGHRRVP